MIRPSSDQELTSRLAELQEANRNLKKDKQARMNALRQLAVNSRAAMGSKFNKVVMAIISSKLEQDMSLVRGEGGSAKYNLGKLQGVV